MKKIGLLCLAIVLALGTMGAGFAYWNETLTIEDPMNTGELDMQVCEGWLGGLFDPPIYYPDTDDDGIWDSGKDIKEYIPFGFIVEAIPVRGDYDVGQCTIVNQDCRTYTVTLSNVYPGYMAKVWWAMHNTGTIPTKIESVSLQSVSDTDGLMPYVRAAGRVKIQKGQGWGRRYDHHWFNCDPWYDNLGLLSEMPGELKDKIDPYVLQPGWRVLIGCVDGEDEELDEEEQGNSLLFVIDEGAPEGATLSFDLKMTWTQFNN